MPAPKGTVELLTVPTVTAPRQWRCEELPELNIYLAGLSYRPRRADLNLPTEDAPRYRRGDFFEERYAKFAAGKFVTSDTEVAAELERIELAGIAPIFEDYAPDTFRCVAHGYMTTNQRAWEQHLRTKHKEGFAPQIFDPAQDPLGVEQDTQF